MKKAISFLLALLMCLSMCACGDGGDTIQETKEESPYAEVEEKLIGQWGLANVNDIGTDYKVRFFEFREDGHGNLLIFDIEHGGANAVSDWEITYEISEDKITYEASDGKGWSTTGELLYSFDDGNLSFYQKNALTNHNKVYFKDDWLGIMEVLRKEGRFALENDYAEYIQEE